MKKLENSRLYESAIDKFNEGDYNSALNVFLKLAEEGENDFRVFNYLGVIYSYAGSYENAVKYFRETVKSNPEYANAYSNLGIIHSNLGDFSKAAEYFEKAVEKENNNYLTFYNYGIALKESGKIKEAFEAMKKSVFLNNSFAAAHFHLSLLFLFNEDYINGWGEYEWGYKSGDLRERKTEKPRWRGENPDGKTLYIYSDQGFGDMFQFLRYLPEIKKSGGKIVLEVEKQTSGIAKRFGYFNMLTDGTPDRSFKTDFDYHIPLLSIPGVFGKDFRVINEPVPYLFADQEKIEMWKKIITNNGKLNAGFVWTGNPHPPENRKRHMTLSDFAPLFECENVNWYSLQKGELYKTETAGNSEKFIDLADKINDFDDTAAAIENLDLVITIDTSVAHLAGAMGKNCWVMLANVPDWRWGLTGELCKWYPSLRLFRQPERGDWNSVIYRIKNELKGLSNN